MGVCTYTSYTNANHLYWYIFNDLLRSNAFDVLSSVYCSWLRTKTSFWTLTLATKTSSSVLASPASQKPHLLLADVMTHSTVFLICYCFRTRIQDGAGHRQNPCSNGDRKQALVWRHAVSNVAICQCAKTLIEVCSREACLWAKKEWRQCDTKT